MKDLNEQERLILSNQYKILSFIDKDNAKQHLDAAEIFEQGYEYLYNEYDNIPSPYSPEESKEVISILNLYRELNNSYKAAKDKDGLKESEVSFPGFDHNDAKEAKMAIFAQFLTENLGRYDEIKSNLGGEHGWNSHCLMVPKYLRMIEKLDSMTPLANRYYSTDQIRKILDA